MSTRPLRVGLAGLGNVGRGVVQLLRDNRVQVAARAGRPIEVTAVAVRNTRRKRDLPKRVRLTGDALTLVTDDQVDVVVEMIGGSDGIAKAVVQAAIAARKPVVTANKALLAQHGMMLLGDAEKRGVPIQFEAAVAGGIPILKALREGLAGNQIKLAQGILNGTCNYILTEMRATGRSFADVLADAQRLGYAEADPSFDVDGVDAAHKLAILAALAFNAPIDFKSVRIEGIRQVSAVDIAYAEEFGYRIKLLAVAARTAQGLEQRVHPCLVPTTNPLATVDGVFNAVMTEGDFVGRSVFEGRGAGTGPTASAVVADLIDIAAGRASHPLGMPIGALTKLPAAPLERHVGRYYVRLQVRDKPGVMAEITAVLRDCQISIESLLQRGRAESEKQPVAVVLITHETEEGRVRQAIGRIARSKVSLEPPHVMRIEKV